MKYPTSTHTLATLEVAPSTYEDVKKRLLAADYGHTIDSHTGHIDMTGIALAMSATAFTAEEVTEGLDALSNAMAQNGIIVVDLDDDETSEEP